MSVLVNDDKQLVNVNNGGIRVGGCVSITNNLVSRAKPQVASRERRQMLSAIFAEHFHIEYLRPLDLYFTEYQFRNECGSLDWFLDWIK